MQRGCEHAEMWERVGGHRRYRRGWCVNVRGACVCVQRWGVQGTCRKVRAAKCLQGESAQCVGACGGVYKRVCVLGDAV